MVEPIQWLHSFVLHYPSFEYIIIFLGVGFGGELALLSLGFLAAQNVISIYPLILFSFFGTFISDILWFFLGRTEIIKKIVAHRYMNTTIDVINKAISRMSKGNHFVALVFGKFLIGTRVLLIMYVSSKNIDFKKFIRYDAVAILIWLLVIIPIGFLSGLGFIYFAEILKNVSFAVGFILLIVTIVIIIEIWLKKKFTEEGN